MQPQALAVHVDTGFIGMQDIRARQLISGDTLEVLQALECLSVEVVDRAATHRDLHLFRKVVLDPVVRDQLELGHIDRMRLQVGPILDRAGHMRRELGHEPSAILILEDLCPVFGDELGYLDIDHLACLKAAFLIFTARQRPFIDGEHFDLIRIIDLLERGADMPLLPSPVVAGLGLFLALSIRV